MVPDGVLPEGRRAGASPLPQVDSVFVLNDFCYVQGGASKVAIEEAVALRARGLDVTFLGAVGAACEALRDGGVRVVSLGQPELADAGRHPAAVWRGLWNKPAVAALGALLGGRDARRCIVHLHGYTKALTAFPALAAKRAGFSTVCTLHDFFAACPNGAFYHYGEQKPCELAALSVACMAARCDKRNSLHKAYRVVRGQMQRHLAQFPASVRDYIALSRRSAALLRPYLPRDARLYDLPNVIDVARSPPVDAAANRAVVVVGRLDAEKGVDLAAEAARRLQQPVVFVGDGPLRPAVEAAGATVTGWLPSEGVQRAIGDARCLVFPSRWYEAFGLVVDEAAARGVPAVVSDVSAAAERVTDGIDGWIFESGSADDLARRLAVVRDNWAIRAAGAAAYQRYWADPHDRSHHAEQLVAIYDAVLARGVPG
jgi:glycosyltransferase involved in cell wall biosynthesis